MHFFTTLFLVFLVVYFQVYLICPSSFLKISDLWVVILRLIKYIYSVPFKLFLSLVSIILMFYFLTVWFLFYLTIFCYFIYRNRNIFIVFLIYIFIKVESNIIDLYRYLYSIWYFQCDYEWYETVDE